MGNNDSIIKCPETCPDICKCDVCKTDTDVIQTSDLNENSNKNTNKNSNLSSFEQRILSYHNNTRRNAGLPDLEWESSYVPLAKKWNEYLRDNESCTIRHPINSQKEKDTYIPFNIGQNLWSAVSNNPNADFGDTAKSATLGWYNECKDYKPLKKDQEIPDNFSQVGHFTQMQWKDAKKVGCHEIDCPSSGGKKKIINCLYDKGNVGGQFNQQVIYKNCPINF